MRRDMIILLMRYINQGQLVMVFSVKKREVRKEERRERRDAEVEE